MAPSNLAQRPDYNLLRPCCGGTSFSSFSAPTTSSTPASYSAAQQTQGMKDALGGQFAPPVRRLVAPSRSCSRVWSYIRVSVSNRVHARARTLDERASEPAKHLCKCTPVRTHARTHSRKIVPRLPLPVQYDMITSVLFGTSYCNCLSSTSCSLLSNFIDCSRLDPVVLWPVKHEHELLALRLFHQSEEAFASEILNACCSVQEVGARPQLLQLWVMWSSFQWNCRFSCVSMTERGKGAEVG